MNLQDIITELSAILTSVTEIAFVYSDRKPNIEGYPAIVFDVTDVDNQVLTNVENLESAIITIYIVQEIKEATIALANQYLNLATKAVIKELASRSNLSLNSTVDWIEPVKGGRKEQVSTTGAVLWQEIKVKVVKSSSTLP